ncbi:putative orphan protein [Lachnospiraceae bacterium KM106-2]|nr:putative orphan protein [Lachnospiraceae bacterium KM106-2]
MEKPVSPFELHDTDIVVACVGDNGGTDNNIIKEGFKNSVYILINEVYKGKSEDELIYPIIYNARHSIELSLKIIINKIFKICKIKNKHFNFTEKESLFTHNIERLDKTIKDYYSIDKRIRNPYEDISPYLKDYFIDKDGDAFKYESNKDGLLHMRAQGISSISIDIFKEKYKIIMSGLDRLIYELDYLYTEYSIGTFTQKLSREDLSTIAKSLPERNNWSDSEFPNIKKKIIKKYEISSNELSKALDIIQNNREFSVNIKLEQKFNEISKREIQKYVEYVFSNDKTQCHNSSKQCTQAYDSKKLLTILRENANKRNEFSEGISDAVIYSLLSFYICGRNRDTFSEQLDIIYSNIVKNRNDKIECIRKIEKKDSLLYVLYGMKKCGQETYFNEIQNIIHNYGETTSFEIDENWIN